MSKILIILPYFGRFHSYFNLWIQSVLSNPSIDFIIFTDNEEVFSASNIKIVKLAFEDFRAMVQDKFDFNICLDKPYKICDFRPAFGFIFSDYIKDYDFWGHCDCDLIFGDIRHFITESVLASYDKILDWGHLCLYRNRADVNNMFRQRLDGVRYFKNVFSSPIPQCFDESCGAVPIWSTLAPQKVYSRDFFDDINYRKGDFYKVDGVSPCLYEYSHGRLLRCTQSGNTCLHEEICYVHFQKRVMATEVSADASSFCVVPNSFVPYTPFSAASFKRYAYKGVYWKPIKVLINTYITKLRRKV